MVKTTKRGGNTPVAKVVEATKEGPSTPIRIDVENRDSISETKPSAITIAMAESYFKSDEEFDPFEHLNLPFDDIPTKVGKDEMCVRCSYRDIPRCPMKGTDLCAKIRGRAD